MFSTFSKDVFLAAVEDIITDMDLLHPEELRLAASFFSAKRREDFYRGRIAARRAIALVGGEDSSPLLVGGNGEPLWPETIAGSISHSAALAVAAVALKSDMPLLGIDLQEIVSAERAAKLLARIATDTERSWAQADRSNMGLRGTAIFSLKEAAYKMLSPYVAAEEKLHFSDIEIQFDGEHSRSARLERTLAFRPEFSHLEYLLVQGNLFSLCLEHRDSLLFAAMWSDSGRHFLAREFKVD